MMSVLLQRLRSCFMVVTIPMFSQCGGANSGQRPQKDLKSNIAEKERTSSIVEEEKDLKTCDASLEGTLAYIKSLSQFRFCSGKLWTTIDLKGDKGEAGTAGVQGTSGTSGQLEEQWQAIYKGAVMNTAFIGLTYSNNAANPPSISVSGTGFIVAANIVATNGHVVGHTFVNTSVTPNVTYTLNRIDVWFPNKPNGDTQNTTRAADAQGTQVERTIAATDDMALIQVNTGGRTQLKLSARDESPDYFDKTKGITLGEEILLLGYSGGTSFPHFTNGKINAIQPVTTQFLGNLITPGRLIY